MSSVTVRWDTLLRDVPRPPVDMAMPATNTIVVVLNFAVLLAVLVVIVRIAIRDKSSLGLLMMLGAAIGSLQEPIYDIMGSVWYPADLHGSTFHAFGISIPWWLLPAYGWYIGGLGFLVYKVLQRPDVERKRIWQLYGLFWLANFALEMPGLNLHVYEYYGNQPLKLFGFPLWMSMSNAVMPIVLGALVNQLEPILRGRRSLLIVPIVPMVIGSCQISVAWPMWLALNAGQPGIVAQFAAIVCLGFSLTIVYLVCVLRGAGRTSA